MDTGTGHIWEEKEINVRSIKGNLVREVKMDLKECVEVLNEELRQSKEKLNEANATSSEPSPYLENLISNLSFAICILERMSEERIRNEIIAFCIVNTHKSKYITEDWHRGMKDIVDELAQSILRELEGK